MRQTISHRSARQRLSRQAAPLLRVARGPLQGYAVTTYVLAAMRDRASPWRSSRRVPWSSSSRCWCCAGQPAQGKWHAGLRCRRQRRCRKPPFAVAANGRPYRGGPDPHFG